MQLERLVTWRRQVLLLGLTAVACGDVRRDDRDPSSVAVEDVSRNGSGAGMGEGGGIGPGDEYFQLGVTPSFSSTHGSGNFGQWTTDANGLPAYRYTNGSSADRQQFQAQRPHHLLGNAGSLTHSYSDGQHVLFSARTFPRYANYFRPERQAWSGGFGWIRDRSLGETWSTYFPEARDVTRFETTWGMGYARKQVERKQVEVIEDTFSPVGDDEVILQRIKISNRGTTAKSLSYYSYWSWDSYIMQGSLLAGNTPYYEDEDYTLYCDPQRQALKAAIVTRGGDLSQPNAIIDPSARVAFFSLLNRDKTMAGYEMVKDNVFSPGVSAPVPDRLRPDGLIRSGAACDNRPGLITYNSRDMLFVAESRVDLAPGASTTLYTVYGMARKNLEDTSQPNKLADEIIDKYRDHYEGRFDETVADFARKSVRFTPPSAADSWLSREVAWSNYHLHAGLLREDWFGVHTLNQNSQYLLDAGQNIAPRDNVQHIQPLIYSSPQIAKETLIFVLRNMLSASGELPFGSSGYGAVAAISSLPWPAGWRPSDLGLWLGLGIAEYVHATRDFAFLDEKHPYRDSNRTNPGSWPSVYTMLKAAMRYQLDDVGTGEHGLVRIRTSDWADGLTGDSGNEPATHERGESTFNTALAAWVYPMVRELALRRNDSELAGRLETAASTMRTELMQEWKGNMFNRAYMIDAQNRVVELGGDVFWAESNNFALLPENLLSSEQLQSMLDMLTSTPGLITPLGVNITGPLPPGYMTSLRVKPGNTTWYSLNGALIRGLAGYAQGSDDARELAWEELKRNTLAAHATVYPNMFYGLTSGSDAWYTELHNTNPSVEVPGSSWLERPLSKLFPNGYEDKAHSINNMHSHSHLVYNTLRLAGVQPTAAGYTIRPAIAPGETIAWESETFGVRYDGDQIAGKIRPTGAGPVSLTVALTPQLNDTTSLSVQSGGSTIPFERTGDALTFELMPSADQTVLWSIRTTP